MPAGAAAAATFGTAVIGSRSNNRAMAAQERARQEALAYERSVQDRQDQARNQYRQDYAEWLERNYGVRRLSGGSPKASTTLPTPTAAPGAMPEATPAVPGAPGTPPAVPGAPPLIGTANQQPRTLADFGGWNDWRRYGAGA